MKKVFIIGILLSLSGLIKAQIHAVTEVGDEVVLFPDGTWSYVNDSLSELSEIFVNEKEFLKDKKSSFLVKSKKVNIGVWIDPKTWSFVKGKDEDAFEFQFEKKGDDLYAMLIAEKLQIPIESLKGIAIENARSVAPDIAVINEEFRNVNGVQVLMMQMTGTIQGMRFTYYGYYFSSENGTIQLLTYTGESLFDDYFEAIEKFLNGFVVLE